MAPTGVGRILMRRCAAVGEDWRNKFRPTLAEKIKADSARILVEYNVVGMVGSENPPYEKWATYDTI